MANEFKMKKPGKKIWVILTFFIGAILAVLIYSALLIHFLHVPSRNVIAQWKKPAAPHYSGDLEYYLSITEGELDWRGFPLEVQRRCFVYVGLDSGKPNYGHTIDFTFYPDQSHYHDLPGYLKNASVQWDTNGVTLILPSEHRLFIPKAMFVGGR